MKFLFIDDDLDVIDHYSKVIKKLYPHAVLMQESDSRKAYDLIINDKEPVKTIDLIITDYRMPEYDGGDIFQASRLNILDIPIMILTAVDQEEVSRNLPYFNDTGRHNKILSKPATEQQLKEAIDFCLMKKANSFTYEKN